MFLLSRHSRRGVSGDVKLPVMRHRHSRSLLVAYVVYYVQAIEQKGDVSGSSHLTGCFFVSRIAWGSFLFTTLNSRETHLVKQSCILLRTSSKELNSVDLLLPPQTISIWSGNLEAVPKSPLFYSGLAYSTNLSSLTAFRVLHNRLARNAQFNRSRCRRPPPLRWIADVRQVEYFKTFRPARRPVQQHLRRNDWDMAICTNKNI